jgi:hypothetical protein
VYDLLVASPSPFTATKISSTSAAKQTTTAEGRC